MLPILFINHPLLILANAKNSIWDSFLLHVYRPKMNKILFLPIWFKYNQNVIFTYLLKPKGNQQGMGGPTSVATDKRGEGKEEKARRFRRFRKAQ